MRPGVEEAQLARARRETDSPDEAQPFVSCGAGRAETKSNGTAASRTSVWQRYMVKERKSDVGYAGFEASIFLVIYLIFFFFFGFLFVWTKNVAVLSTMGAGVRT